MRGIYIYNQIKVKAYPGTTIKNAIEEILNLSEKYSCDVILEFNEKEVICLYSKMNTVEKLVEGYFKK